MSDNNDKLYGAVELARDLGITPRALRFYETKGLITPQRSGKWRIYTHRDRARVQIVMRGKRLGFSLAEIREYLELYDADPTQTDQLQNLYARVADRIEDLERQREALEFTLDELRSIQGQTLNALTERGAEAPSGISEQYGEVDPTPGIDAPKRHSN
ncbi:MAG: MerR family DNA-binding transcriptional regulator [Pseudomonadota bacterium]